MKIIVRVTQKDIRDGKPGNGVLCPVARALHRAVGPVVREVRVGTTSASWSKEENERGAAIWKFVNLRPRMSLWIQAFDKGQPMKPTRTTLTVQDLI